MRHITTALLICSLAVAFVATAFADDTPWIAPLRAAKKKNLIAADDASVGKGKVLYVKECLTCHGPAGKGDGPGAKQLEKPPGNLSDPKVWDQSDGALFWKITEGRKPMPSMEKTFTEEERWQVVNYVRTLAPKPRTAN